MLVPPSIIPRTTVSSATLALTKTPLALTICDRKQTMKTLVTAISRTQEPTAPQEVRRTDNRLFVYDAPRLTPQKNLQWLVLTPIDRPTESHSSD